MITEKQYFYIIGYPRSRSTWFSVFMNTQYTQCQHELLSKHDPRMVDVLINCPRPFSGSADTNPISLLKINVPPGPVCMVRRPKEDVVRSFLNSFDPVKGLSDDQWELYATNIMDYYEVALDYFEQYSQNIMVVEFKDLKDVNVLKQIWAHLVPEPGCMPEDWYFRQWNDLRISVVSRDVTKNIEYSNERRGITWDKGMEDTLNFDVDAFRVEFEKVVTAAVDRNRKMQEAQERHLILPEDFMPSQYSMN